MASGNGNGRPTTTVGALSSLSEKLVGALPPTMLLLVILNILFLGVAAYVFQHNTEIRNQMIQRIIDKCLSSTSNLTPEIRPR